MSGLFKLTWLLNLRIYETLVHRGLNRAQAGVSEVSNFDLTAKISLIPPFCISTRFLLFLPPYTHNLKIFPLAHFGARITAQM